MRNLIALRTLENFRGPHVIFTVFFPVVKNSSRRGQVCFCEPAAQAAPSQPAGGMGAPRWRFPRPLEQPRFIDGHLGGIAAVKIEAIGYKQGSKLFVHGKYEL